HGPAGSDVGGGAGTGAARRRPVVAAPARYGFVFAASKGRRPANGMPGAPAARTAAYAAPVAPGRGRDRAGRVAIGLLCSRVSAAAGGAPVTWRRLLAGLLSALPAVAASTATGEPLSLLGISAGKSGASLSVPMQIVVLLTLMTVLPAVVMSITPF